MIVLGLMVAAAGIALYVLARHGFAVGTHPYCTACNFNLTGLPKDRQRCPECGADIHADGAVRIGHRRPVLAGMVAGALLILAGAGFLASEAAAWWRKFDASSLKPVAMLEHDLTDPRESSRRPAFRELTRRIRAGSLTKSQADHLGQTILKRQQAVATKWDERLGDLLQAARQQRLLSNATWEAYVRQAMTLKIDIRPQVASQDPLPVRVECHLQAGMTDAGMEGATLAPEVTLMLDGQTIAIPMSPTPIEGFPRPVEWTSITAGNINRTPGKHLARVTAALTYLDPTGQHITTNVITDLDYEALGPRVSSVARHAATPEESADMRAAVHWLLPEGPLKIKAGQPNPLGSLLLSGPPVAADFRVVLRQGGREWPLARLLVRANDGMRVPLTLPAAAVAVQSGPAELVCIPENGLAVGTVDVLEIWGSELARTVELSVE